MLNRLRVQIDICHSIIECIDGNPRANYEWFLRNFPGGVQTSMGDRIEAMRFAAMCRSVLRNGTPDFGANSRTGGLP